MEDPQKEVPETISQQPKLEHKENLDLETSEENIPNLQIRKQRGIFTTTAKDFPPNYYIPRLQDNYFQKFESGDNAHIQNLREFVIQETETIQRNNEEMNSEISNENSQSTAVTTCSPDFNTNENSINGSHDESAVLENVDNLIGNYQVNPLDGSLVKISTVQSINDVQNDLEIDGRRKRASSGNEWHDIPIDECSQPGSHCRRKYRKRKYRDTKDDEEYIPSNHRSTGGIPKPTGDKAEEVLKAAKSLFSKRTRTLYHWLYPSTSKLELKNIVISAWDTLQESEKHFYISQVLGRFGFPASNLMVNPQIGGLQGMPTDHLRGSIAMASSTSSNHTDGMYDDTKRVVEELLANNYNNEWGTLPKSNRLFGERRKRKKTINCNSLVLVNEDNSLQPDTPCYTGDEESNSTNFEDEEFQNDPELNKEIVAFRMNTGIDLNMESGNLQT